VLSAAKWRRARLMILDSSVMNQKRFAAYTTELQYYYQVLR
jgi:hypothetical protein